MKITDKIKNALGRAVDEKGSQSALAVKTGITQATIARYLNGEIKIVSDDAWAKLYPYIGKWLQAEVFSRHLDKLMTDLNISTVQLSRKANLPVKTIQDYRKGEQVAPVDDVRAICAALKVNMSRLMPEDYHVALSESAPSIDQQILLDNYMRLAPDEKKKIIDLVMRKARDSGSGR